MFFFLLLSINIPRVGNGCVTHTESKQEISSASSRSLLWTQHILQSRLSKPCKNPEHPDKSSSVTMNHRKTNNSTSAIPVLINHITDEVVIYVLSDSLMQAVVQISVHRSGLNEATFKEPFPPAQPRNNVILFQRLTFSPIRKVFWGMNASKITKWATGQVEVFLWG